MTSSYPSVLHSVWRDWRGGRAVSLEIQHLLKAFPVRNMTSGSAQRMEGCAATGRAFLSNQSDIASSDHWTGIAECPAACRTLNPLAPSQGNRTPLRTMLCCSSFPPREGHRMSPLSHASAREFDNRPLQWPQDTGTCPPVTAFWRCPEGFSEAAVCLSKKELSPPLWVLCCPRWCLTALLCLSVSKCLFSPWLFFCTIQSLGFFLWSVELVT